MVPGKAFLVGRRYPQGGLQSERVDLDGDGTKELVACWNRPKSGFARGWFMVLSAAEGQGRATFRRRIPWRPSVQRLLRLLGLAERKKQKARTHDCDGVLISGHSGTGQHNAEHKFLIENSDGIAIATSIDDCYAPDDEASAWRKADTHRYLTSVSAATKRRLPPNSTNASCSTGESDSRRFAREPLATRTRTCLNAPTSC
jgi:hypothetical protein